MAIKDIVKGICNITRCKYDVYTKERTDELLKTKLTSSDVYVKGDFATVIANITIGDDGLLGNVTVPFPDGFTKDNCIVISTMYKNSNEHRYRNGYIQTGSAITNIVVGLGLKNGTDDSKITIEAYSNDELMGGATYNVKVTLMKIS